MAAKTIPTPGCAYPFSAVLGQEQAKTALLLNLVDGKIGGVLLAGKKGTGKSTLIHALAGLVPEMPVRKIPLNISEDRFLGGFDWDVAVKTGHRIFTPGLLAEAHGGMIYLDEVNLMPDKILALILDAAATGRVKLERDGFSLSYPCSFRLFASMNPEEGGLSPETLDRFGLCVGMRDEFELPQRSEILKRCLAQQEAPEEFRRAWLGREENLGSRIQAALARLGRVSLPEEILESCISKSREAGCLGHRAELALCRAAQALAAWNGIETVTEESVQFLAPLALIHRSSPASKQTPRQRGSDPESDSNGQSGSKTETPESFRDNPRGNTRDLVSESGEPNAMDSRVPPGMESEPDSPGSTPSSEEARLGILKGYSAPKLPSASSLFGKTAKVRKQLMTFRTSPRNGVLQGSGMPIGRPRDIAWDATLKQSLLFRKSRPKGNLAVSVFPEDIRVKAERHGTGRVLLFLVDASGSMGTRKRIAAAKGCIFSILEEAYARHDRVAMMAFRHRKCELILPLTRSLDLAHRLLEEIPTGGETPLGLSLETALNFCRTLKIREPGTPIHVLLFTDGRANVSLTGANPREEVLELCEESAKGKIHFTVVDTEAGFVRLGLAQDMARVLEADYYPLDQLRRADTHFSGN